MKDTRKLFSKPITTSAGAYAINDQVGSLQTLVGAADLKGQVVVIDSLSIVDTAQQKSDLVVLLFSKPPTITSTDNNALAISDSEIADKLLCALKVANADYNDVAQASIACYGDLGIQIEPREPRSGLTTGQDVYALVLSKGTPTYGSSSSVLTIHIGVKK